MNTITIPGVSPWILALIVLWTIPWKGIALWKAGRLSHKWWFIVLLVLNTVGILEIIYIFLIARKYNIETINADEKVNSVSQTVKTTEVKTVVTESSAAELPTIEAEKSESLEK